MSSKNIILEELGFKSTGLLVQVNIKVSLGISPTGKSVKIDPPENVFSQLKINTYGFKYRKHISDVGITSKKLFSINKYNQKWVFCRLFAKVKPPKVRS